jgi:hypothetical protein
MEAKDMQMARYWCDKRKATETNSENVHNSKQRKGAGKYERITGGRTKTAQMTLTRQPKLVET